MVDRLVEKVRSGAFCSIHKSTVTCTKEYSAKDDYTHVYCPICGLVDGYSGK
jgi:predicted RNA-binding Zn-ribbon protein involved in translation (DUF1610 family)